MLLTRLVVMYYDSRIVRFAYVGPVYVLVFVGKRIHVSFGEML